MHDTLIQERRKKRGNRSGEMKEIVPHHWVPPCGSQCTQKYAALTQIPWRVFCKKGCSADGDTWDECIDACDQICYKDPVLKDKKWSAYIDRSPGVPSYSEDCFHACIAGCGYKFEVPAEIVEEVHPNRPTIPPAPPKKVVEPQAQAEDDMPSTSA